MKLLSCRPLSSIGGLAGLVFVCSVSVHPFGRVKQADAKRMKAEELPVPSDVKSLLGRSCVNCHSDQTTWPWYSYVAPVSWFVERDVRRGRDRLNLSQWPEYSLKRQERLLADIASVVKNREMPLPQYVLLHREAKLSDSELETVYRWARLERRRVKAASAISPRPENAMQRRVSQ